MRTTYITRMPDKAGSFLRASRVIAANGGNVTRVSYNKALDVHTLFVEVSARPDQLERIGEELERLGYLAQGHAEPGVILVSLTVPDVPGGITPVLEVLHRHDVSISYISSQENGTAYQHFKMGLLVEDVEGAKELLEELARLCELKVLEYDATEKVLDGTVFYIGFANEMRRLLGLSQQQVNEVTINANRIMQMLDERDEAPLKTFDYILRFARFIVEHKGEGFNATVGRLPLTERVVMHWVEPPCGSNTYILEDTGDPRGRLLFVDCGFACYEAEMRAILRGMFEDFDARPKDVALTHCDVDHAGIVHLFDTLYLNHDCWENFELERAGLPDFREQSPRHAPYCTLGKIISGYRPPDLDNVAVLGDRSVALAALAARDGADPAVSGADDPVLVKIGELCFGDMRFDVYQGPGGHVRGETVFACPQAQVAFTGDILVNIAGFSSEQRAFNKLAPYLMTSVNLDSAKATACREELERRFAGYLMCPGHGPLIGRSPWGGRSD